MSRPLERGRFAASLGLSLSLVCLTECANTPRVAPKAASFAAGTGIVVETAPSQAVNTFNPLRDLGAGIDRFEPGSVELQFSEAMLKPVLASGWGAVSYRLNTELHVEAWHWNPNGTWSDPSGRGYFTGSATPGEPIRHSFGYPLPRRGFTHNEGTERVGYSRLTDGDSKSFWKSNPYLSPEFTGESDAAFPQWVSLELERAQSVDALRIAWAEPYAKSYRIEYWVGEDPMRKPTSGEWRPFENGSVSNGKGGVATHQLGRSPVKLKYLRVLMTDSSHSCVAGDATDRRNCVGYAIAELELGTFTATGELKDLVQHSPDQQQTASYCSSVDPWHTPADLDEKQGELPGLDLFFGSGVTRGLPAMVPVSTVYGTPEDSAAEIAYLQKRGYPLSSVELGEEPDGQYMTPEHYAALYLQWATAIHRVDPKLKLGGPAFTGFSEDIQAWPDAQGNHSWFTRFLNYLKAHQRLADLGFMSFEHYPYQPCQVTWDSLYDEPRLISHSLQVWRDDGLPKDVPMLVTEVNLSFESNQSSVENLGGLWLADYVGALLRAGGKGSYYFHYTPFPLGPGCDENSWGTFGMFKANAAHQIEQPTSQFFVSQLINQQWAQPVDAIHSVFPAESEVRDARGRVVVTAYAVKRPDGKWSLLLINKDPMQAHAIHVAFHDSDARRDRAFSGPVQMTSFGADNYLWFPNGASGYADPDGPAVSSEQPGGASTEYTLPRASVTVLRGTLD